MPEMKRMSISVPPEIAQKIIDLRKTDEFCECSYSEIFRQMVRIGLESQTNEKGN